MSMIITSTLRISPKPAVALLLQNNTSLLVSRVIYAPFHNTVLTNNQAWIKQSEISPLQVSNFEVFNSQRRYLADAKEVSSKLDEFRKGQFDTIPDPQGISHFKTNHAVKKSHSTENLGEVEKKSASTDNSSAVAAAIEKGLEEDGLFTEKPPIGAVVLPHPIWSEKQVNSIKITHKEPEGFVDKLAYGTVRLFRAGFDVFSGFVIGKRNERKWLNRICFLETVAGVPGMVAAMLRHMKSLRRLQRDMGWIHTLLEEAENERMHLMTALQLKQPSMLFRLSVIGAQGIFVTMFAGCYIVSPRFCHRFVGYLEEEAVKTYTRCLADIDDDEGPMKHWKSQAAPDVAKLYWKLDSNATMRDVILAIRADEAHHRVVNHSLASLKEDEFNPYKPGR